MSDFTLSPAQRRRLLAGSYEPLDFPDDPKLEPGARYVLRWMRGTPEWEPGHGIRALRLPLWFITVTQVQRHRKGFWRVRFDVTDNRDPDVFLRRGGGYTGWDELGAGAVPDAEWLDSHSEMIASFWVRRRLERHTEGLRARGRERSRARRKRAA